MQTIKTAVVVVLLLGVCYGAYVALNAPEPTLPETLQDWNQDGMALDVDNGAAVSIPQLSQTPSPAALDSLSPPNVMPPAPTGSTASSSLSIPSLPAGMSNNPSGKLPDVVAPPTTLGNLASNSNNTTSGPSKNGLGNDIPGLPELSLPKEGDSVPLPDLPGSDTASPPPMPPSLSTSIPNDSTALPPVPDFPGQSDSTSQPGNQTGKPAGSDGFPSATSLLTSSSPAGPTGIKAAPSKEASRTTQPFAIARDEALKLANEGKLREALAMMSPYYNHIELTHQEHLDLTDLLDALAVEVIYSRRHLLESKFIVSPGDTLESIANKYRISPEVLANINRLGDSRVVLAGTEMKVLTGPFRCEVDANKGELTFFLGELYAGRFVVSIGEEPHPADGTYTVVERRRDHHYVGADSKFIPANDPRNPYGGYWIHLGSNICIHGSPATSTPENTKAGCISLAPLDAKEVYAMLTQGAEVTIKH